jgi:hypothetical protein
MSVVVPIIFDINSINQINNINPNVGYVNNTIPNITPPNIINQNSSNNAGGDIIMPNTNNENIITGSGYGE